MKADTPLRVLVVGQTPPPYGGQHIMIEYLLNGAYAGVALHHVRMTFSPTLEEAGRFRFRKLLTLVALIGRMVYTRWRHGADVLLYFPAGPRLVPVLRDLLLLGATRWLFRRTVLYFHAGGVAGYLRSLPRPLQALCRRVYWRADVAIRLSERNPADGEALAARREYIIPNGIPDVFARYRPLAARREAHCPAILFVGLLAETKGVLVLLDALALLRARGLAFRAALVGRWADRRTETAARDRVRQSGLADGIEFPGRLVGAAKWEQYAAASIFCFPTYYEAETFGLVLLEAMQFELPIVASDWRGIPSVVTEGDSGFLVPPRDSQALAEKLEWLLRDPARRAAMGRRGRARFLAEFLLERYHGRVQEVFDALRGSAAP